MCGEAAEDDLETGMVGEEGADLADISPAAGAPKGLATRGAISAARWIAPSTPPPPSITWFAALTIASTASLVTSPCSILIALSHPR